EVGEGGDPAAVRQRLVDNVIGAAAGLHDGAGDLALRDVAHDRVAEGAYVAVIRSGVLAVLDQVVIVQARLHHLRRQIVHVDVTLVEGDDAGRGGGPHKPLPHFV